MDNAIRQINSHLQISSNPLSTNYQQSPTWESLPHSTIKSAFLQYIATPFSIHDLLLPNTLPELVSHILLFLQLIFATICHL